MNGHTWSSGMTQKIKAGLDVGAAQAVGKQTLQQGEMFGYLLVYQFEQLQLIAEVLI